MNTRITLFEISSIAVLIVLGISLPVINIDNSGVLFVAGILTVIFLMNYFKVFSGSGSFLTLKTGISADRDSEG